MMQIGYSYDAFLFYNFRVCQSIFKRVLEKDVSLAGETWLQWAQT